MWDKVQELIDHQSSEVVPKHNYTRTQETGAVYRRKKRHEEKRKTKPNLELSEWSIVARKLSTTDTKQLCKALNFIILPEADPK